MPFAALVVEVDAQDAERLSDALLLAGALSVDLNDARSGTAHENSLYDEPGEAGRRVDAAWTRITLTALFHADADPGSGLREACAECGVQPPPHTLRRVDDGDWVRRSQEQFKPVRVSDRLWVVPSWHSPPDPWAINLVLDPGTAFGTGGHPSTRLCLLWLDENVKGGESLVDYGCGSGILAIAAMKLGATRAVGVDIDPEAIAVAHRNAQRNGVSADFVDARAARDLSGDLVVANILANPLKMLAPVLAQICARGGRLALSGILAPQEADIRECYRPWFALDERTEEEGWLCLSGARL
jgi:ribosomal protein L11 methyltransferase